MGNFWELRFVKHSVLSSIDIQLFALLKEMENIIGKIYVATCKI